MDTTTPGPVRERALDRAEFVTAMGQVATGVTVVATDGAVGRVAQTVSAMCSVSADPPLVIVCINRRSPAAAAVAANGAFTVNVLAEEHADVCDSFAGRGPRPYDFACGDWATSANGAPVLRDAIAAFECTVASAYDEGTHTVFVGRVARSRHREGVPLIHHARAYRRPAPLRAA